MLEVLRLGDREGKVDLTRSGVAQTTMASVEVVRGLGAAGVGVSAGGGGRLMGIFRKGLKRGKGEAENGGTDWKGGEVPLAFTSHRKPPEYVPDGSLLVQVWGVAVDGVDAKLVASKSGFAISPSPSQSDSAGDEPKKLGLGRSISLKARLAHVRTGSASSGEAEVGYIPGRSFVGRVMECGWEVGEEEGRRGEWVVGLMDVRKVSKGPLPGAFLCPFTSRMLFGLFEFNGLIPFSFLFLTV